MEEFAVEITELITKLTPLIVGVFIWPATQWLKKLTWFGNTEPRFIVATLSIFSVAVVWSFFAPEMAWERIIETGLAMSGAATLAHGVKKKIIG